MNWQIWIIIAIAMLIIEVFTTTFFSLVWLQVRWVLPWLHSLAVRLKFNFLWQPFSPWLALYGQDPFFSISPKDT